MKYRGIEWKDDSDLSIKLGKCRQYVCNTMKLGFTYEDIIDRYLGKEYRGITWKNDSDLSIKLGKERRYVNSLTRQGFTREQLIDRYLDSKHEYRGIKWTSGRSLARALRCPEWRISYYKNNKGYTLHEIIDMFLDKNSDDDNTVTI